MEELTSKTLDENEYDGNTIFNSILFIAMYIQLSAIIVTVPFCLTLITSFIDPAAHSKLIGLIFKLAISSTIA